MRGFVLSIISLLFLAFLFTLATTLHDHYLRMERSLLLPQPLSYAAYSIGSAAVSLNSIVGPGISIDADNETLELSIADRIPMENVSEKVSEYASFLEGGLSDQTHASISANLSGVSGGSYGLHINRRYVYTNGLDGDMLFRAESGPTNASSYTIYVSVARERENVTHFNFTESGDVNVTLIYADLNGTIHEEGRVSSDSVSRFQVSYAGGGTLEVGCGRASASAGSLWMQAHNVTAETGWQAILPPPGEGDRVGYEYDAAMIYRINGASVSRRIGT
ncbi:hypothetical protein L0Y65_03120 [Candidatus Micrarchaeota archaeon]|nr:hypothetical protein [Candidatus Micrarchaeota archaeon]